MIDDALGVIAIDNIDRILERNLKIVRSNHKYINKWINDESLIDWVAPRAGSVAFMRYNLDMSATEVCKKLIEEKSTFMVPSDCFDIENHLRIGYGNRLEVLEEGLSRVKEFLDENR
jgi:aspartate/methionine/tyrosine aminotransferase